MPSTEVTSQLIDLTGSGRELPLTA